jgi:hypothetical protein
VAATKEMFFFSSPRKKWSATTNGNNYVNCDQRQDRFFRLPAAANFFPFEME